MASFRNSGAPMDRTPRNALFLGTKSFKSSYRRLSVCKGKTVCTSWRQRPASYRLSRSMSSLSRFARRKKLTAISRDRCLRQILRDDCCLEGPILLGIL